jgi:hypothetical protein
VDNTVGMAGLAGTGAPDGTGVTGVTGVTAGLTGSCDFAAGAGSFPGTVSGPDAGRGGASGGGGVGSFIVCINPASRTEGASGVVSDRAGSSIGSRG